MCRVRPILFNTDMVRAILDGHKTVTRRLIKYDFHDVYGYACAHGMWGEGRETLSPEMIEGYVHARNPPYQPGDILYVRETWCKYAKDVWKGENCHIQEMYGYKANIPKYEDAGRKWHPSIHMPKAAARIWLKVTDVRVEKLQDIDGMEVLREGINSLVHPDAEPYGYFDMNQREMFEQLWNSTIKKSDMDKYGWDANPWVWVIEFERCEKPCTENEAE